MSAPRRRPAASPPAEATPERRRRGWGGPLIAGTLLGLAVAGTVDLGRGERWRTEAVVGVEEAGGGGDLAVEARRVATTPFREQVSARLEPAVRRTLAGPSALARLRAGVKNALASAAERVAGPTFAGNLKTRLTPAAELPATLPALHLDAELTADGRTLVVSARAPTPAAATAAAEAAGEVVVAARTARWREAVARRLAAAESALADTRRRIEAAEAGLARGAPTAVAAARTALADVESRLEAARARLAVMAANGRELTAAAEPPRDLTALAAHPRADALARAAEARDRAEARVAALDDTYGARHPVLLAAERELAEREAALAAEARALVAAAERAVARQRETVAELEAAREARGRALAEREAAAGHAAMRRAELERYRERLAALAELRAALVADRAALAPDARVLLVGDSAAVDGPAAAAALYGGGLAGGLVVGGLVGLLRVGRAQGRGDDVGELALATPLPVIGEVTAARRETRARRGDDGLERLVLRLEGRSQPARTRALVTPQPSPESGRLALALARLLTRDGLTTAVVTLTADPALVPRALRRKGRPDLDAVLAGAVPWDEALQPLGERGPWLLAPAARRAEDAARPRLEPLVDHLARRFDRVLVAAGGLERAESLRAARGCEFTLVLVARGRIRGDALTRGVAELEAVGARPDGLVLLR